MPIDSPVAEEAHLVRGGLSDSVMSSSSALSTASHGTRITPNHSDSFFYSTKNLLDGVTKQVMAHSPLVQSSEAFGKDTSAAAEAQYIPPWSEPFIIGVAGCSGSGKTSVASKIIQEINQPWTILISSDNFYRPLTPEQKQQAFANNYDFDTPESLDLDLMYQCVKSLKEGKRTEIPVYSFNEHDRTEKTITIYGANVILVEGLYALHDDKMVGLMDTKIYVDTDLDICLARRLNRDTIQRGRDLDGILQQWSKFVKPNSVKYVQPTMKKADLVVPRGSDNHIGISMLIRQIKTQLNNKSRQHLAHLTKLGKVFKPLDADRILKLPINNQLKGIHTILLDKRTRRDEFIFYFDRLATMLVTKALDLIEYSKCEVVTPTGHLLDGLRSEAPIVAVSIIRSGDCFMNSIMRTLPDITVGKLLIQSDSLTGEPQLHTESLPPKIYQQGAKVFLFDAQIISGAASIMAIQVLLDHGIALENIVVVSYLVTEIGARRILNAFATVKIVVGLMSQIKRSEDADVEPTAAGTVQTRANFDHDWWFRTRFIDNVYFGTN